MSRDRVFTGSASLVFEFSADTEGYELVLTMDERRWEESRPFGSTVAMEGCSDIVEDSEVITLDNKVVTREALYNKFGQEWIKATLEKLQTDITFDQEKQSDQD